MKIDKHLQDFWNDKLKDDGFKDIEDGHFYDTMRYYHHKGNYFQNRKEYSDYYRIIGLYIHHNEIKEKYKEILECYVECGSIPLAIRVCGSKVKAVSVYKYLETNFKKMLIWVNELDRDENE